MPTSFEALHDQTRPLAQLPDDRPPTPCPAARRWVAAAAIIAPVVLAVLL